MRQDQVSKQQLTFDQASPVDAELKVEDSVGAIAAAEAVASPRRVSAASVPDL